MTKWINNHKQFILVLLVVVPLAFVMVNFLLNFSSTVKPLTKSTAEIEDIILFPDTDVEISVDVAESSAKKARGLMDVTELPDDEGMLFIYDKNVRNGFWMKDTLITLDMIFIDENWEIVDIIEYAQPCEVAECPSYQPSGLYRYVVEVNGGFASKNGIEEGDSVIYQGE